ncbi:MAG: arsenite methyltransferase [Bacteroidota bacterium]
MDSDTIKSAVKEKYGEIAKASSSCCEPTCGCGTDSGVAGTIAMNGLYDDVEKQIREVADLGLGCGTPTAFADLAAGMTVLDLGSGAGIDVFVAAKLIGPSGRAIGVDMTEQMISRAEANRRKLGIENAEFRYGEIENLPVETGSVDRVISNCVINLVPDKKAAFSEILRVLKAGGKFTVSDIVSIGQIPEKIRNDMLQWAGCVAGALDKDEYLSIVREVGFINLKIAAEKPYQLDSSLPFGLRSITLTATKP